jgi:hypothetical protein
MAKVGSASTICGVVAGGMLIRVAATQGQLPATQQSLRPVLGAESNDSLMSDSVSRGVRDDRPLTLRSRRPSAQGSLKTGCGRSRSSGERRRPPEADLHPCISWSAPSPRNPPFTLRMKDERICASTAGRYDCSLCRRPPELDPFQPKAIFRVMDRSTLRPVVESSKESESTSGDPAAPRYCQ